MYLANTSIIRGRKTLKTHSSNLLAKNIFNFISKTFDRQAKVKLCFATDKYQ